MVRHRVETQRSMVVVREEIRRRVEPLFGGAVEVRARRHLVQLPVVRPFSVVAEPRVQVWPTPTEMRELSQVAGAREERAFRRSWWSSPHLQEAPVQPDTSE